MSFLDTIAANTIGLAWNLRGRVDPWTLANIDEENATIIRKALAGNPIQAEYEVERMRASVNSYLNVVGQHPNQPGTYLGDFGTVDEVTKKIGDFAKNIVGGVAQTISNVGQIPKALGEATEYLGVLTKIAFVGALVIGTVYVLKNVAPILKPASKKGRK